MARALPDWPRHMKRNTAARYLDMSGAEFDRLVAAGRLPDPTPLGGWSRLQLDEAIEPRKQGSWRERSKLYGEGQAA